MVIVQRVEAELPVGMNVVAFELVEMHNFARY